MTLSGSLTLAVELKGKIATSKLLAACQLVTWMFPVYLQINASNTRQELRTEVLKKIEAALK